MGRGASVAGAGQAGRGGSCVPHFISHARVPHVECRAHARNAYGATPPHVLPPMAWDRRPALLAGFSGWVAAW